MKEEVYTINGLIPQNYSNYLKNLFLSSNIWGIGEGISQTAPTEAKIYSNIQNQVYDKGQLSCHMFENGIIQHNLFFQVIPLLGYIQEYFGYSYSYDVIRVKANLKHSVSSEYRGMFNPPHVDFSDAPLNSFTILYYLNDSDGDTIIFDEFDKPAIYDPSIKEDIDFPILQTISPEQGRLVIFPTRQFHSANFPIDSPLRSVINFNIVIFPFEE